jgi:hypothetical protein
MEAAQPPVPPQVAAQQGPPLRQFAQGAAQGDPGAGQQQDPSALASQLIDGIGKQMTQLAQVLSTTKPELIPVLKQAVQALSMVQGKVKAQQGGAPQGGNQGTQQDGAPPDSQGGGSMGMPQ